MLQVIHIIFKLGIMGPDTIVCDVTSLVIIVQLTFSFALVAPVDFYRTWGPHCSRVSAGYWRHTPMMQGRSHKKPWRKIWREIILLSQIRIMFLACIAYAVYILHTCTWLHARMYEYLWTWAVISWLIAWVFTINCDKSEFITWMNFDTIENKSVISSVLAFCPSVTLKKMSYEGLAPSWKLSQIVEIRLFRKFQGTEIVKPNHFPAGVLSQNCTFCQNVSLVREHVNISDEN